MGSLMLCPAVALCGVEYQIINKHASILFNYLYFNIINTLRMRKNVTVYIEHTSQRHVPVAFFLFSISGCPVHSHKKHLILNLELYFGGRCLG